jgi:exopolysaccharide production protein ExoQ
MNLVALVISSLIIALMAMPGNINLLGAVGGQLSVSILPIVLSGGLVLGAMVAMQKFSTTRTLLQSTNKYLIFFLCLATISMVWSAYPLTTLYRLYRLYALVLACVLFCLAGWKPERFAKAVLPAVLFLTVASIIYAVIDPNGVLEPAEYNGMILPELVGAWRGVTLHKNTLGAMAAIGVIVACSELVGKKGARFLSWMVLLTSIVCLIGAKSSTAIFTAVFGVALMLLLLKAPGIKNRRIVHAMTFTLVTFFLIYSLGVLNLVPGLGAVIEPIVALSGKDMTFSGRTTIWAIMKDEILQHPLLGIGYASYWLGPDFPSPAFIFKIRMYIYPGEAHNGYLDVMNELGVLGISALIAYLFEYLRQSVRLLAFDRRKASLYIALLFAQLIANMSEAHWLNIASVQFFIMTLATFDIACTLRQKKIHDKWVAAQAMKAVATRAQHFATPEPLGIKP